MKRSSTASTKKLDFSKFSPVADLLASLATAERMAKSAKDDSVVQMHRERIGRIQHALRWRAQHGDAKASAALKRGKR